MSTQSLCSDEIYSKTLLLSICIFYRCWRLLLMLHSIYAVNASRKLAANFWNDQVEIRNRILVLQQLMRVSYWLVLLSTPLGIARILYSETRSRGCEAARPARVERKSCCRPSDPLLARVSRRPVFSALLFTTAVLCKRTRSLSIKGLL